MTRQAAKGSPREGFYSGAPAQRIHTGREPWEGWLESYQPRLDGRTWEPAVRMFVLTCVGKLCPGTARYARESARLLAHLATWGQHQGLPLDAEILLDPAVVERFVSGLNVTQRSSATYRAELRRIGPVLTDLAGWEPRPSSHGGRSVKPPYSAEEMAALIRCIRSQPTKAGYQAGLAMYLLCGGVGADGRWLPRVRPKHVEELYDGLGVELGEPAPRVVPVLRDFEDELREFARTVETPYLLGPNEPSRNLVSRIIGRLAIDGSGVRLSPARLRSTWLVAHLNRGTRLPELARAAGLQSVTVLSDLLSYVEPLDALSAVAEVQGRR